MFKSFPFGNFSSKKEYRKPSQLYEESSDDETCSDSSTEEGLECPICWESFNVVENVPFVLWCGHTICENCLLGLRSAGIKFSNQHIQIPFFVSCPWCNLLTLRFLYKGDLKFPSKNFFLLWMVECRNGDRGKSTPAFSRDDQFVWSKCSTQVMRKQPCGSSNQKTRLARSGSNVSDESQASSSHSLERPNLTLQKSLDFLFCLTARIPLIIAPFPVCFRCTSHQCCYGNAILADHCSPRGSFFLSVVFRISSIRLACKGDCSIIVYTSSQISCIPLVLLLYSESVYKQILLAEQESTCCCMKWSSGVVVTMVMM